MTNRREFLQHTAGAVAAVSLIPALESMANVILPAPVNVGLVGAGRQGRAILAELQKIEGVTVTAVCDVVESRLSSGLRRVKGAHYQTMQGLGHFPMSEDPERFLTYIRPILAKVRESLG